MEKTRLDVMLYNLGIAKSREKAKLMIASNLVSVNNKVINKPGLMVDDSCKIIVEKPETEYVGRGAYKLEKAINYFKINLTDKICIDVGASTGGFTDFMLKHGCAKVYAVDVGHSQLADELLSDHRVVSMEKTNFRYVNKSLFADNIDFISIDVSFISLELIIPKVVELCNKSTEIVALVKPQFEAGKGNVGKNGIVNNKKQHISIINKVYNYCTDSGLFISNITFSPITGGDGNIEYLLHLKQTMDMSFENVLKNTVEKTVNEAFKSFN